MEKMIVSIKHSSLAFDECLREIEKELFEPDLKVVINAQYNKLVCASNDLNVVQVQGRITVSF